MSDLVIRRARPDELPLCHELRRIVFIEGQGVPPEIDRDGLDAGAIQLLALRAEAPVGTARMRPVADATMKAERVAVLAVERRGGIGRALMERLEAEARERGCTTLTLHAQEEVVAFYERLGYAAQGERFLEADIWHREMSKPL